MTKNNCTYCKRITQTKLWKETNEEVCYECRLDFLEREFFEEDEKDELRRRYGI